MLQYLLHSVTPSSAWTRVRHFLALITVSYTRLINGSRNLLMLLRSTVFIFGVDQIVHILNSRQNTGRKIGEQTYVYSLPSMVIFSSEACLKKSSLLMAHFLEAAFFYT